jgi:quercetin dioxygenase-like cupin family protein
MANVGDVIRNKEAGIKMVFIKTAKETDGELLKIDMFVSPCGYVVYEHFHPIQDEAFEIISGTLRFCVDGIIKDLNSA